MYLESSFQKLQIQIYNLNQATFLKMEFLKELLLNFEIASTIFLIQENDTLLISPAYQAVESIINPPSSDTPRITPVNRFS